jgi:hypothetical protein
MSYTDTLIKVAEDCPVATSEIPVPKKNGVPAHVIQYELLKNNPYQYNHEALTYEVYIRQKEIPASTLQTDTEKIKQELFSKGHPCMRASALTKRYGWGAHYDAEGKIAIYPQESENYKALLDAPEIKKVPAMRSKR